MELVDSGEHWRLGDSRFPEEQDPIRGEEEDRRFFGRPSDCIYHVS